MSLDSVTEAISLFLKAVAKDRKTVTYQWLMKNFNISMDDLENRLDTISTYEHAKGRALLSAIVVDEDTGYPHKRFIELAKKLGRFKE